MDNMVGWFGRGRPARSQYVANSLKTTRSGNKISLRKRQLSIMNKNLFYFILLLVGGPVAAQDKNEEKNDSLRITAMIGLAIETGKKDSAAARKLFMEAFDK